MIERVDRPWGYYQVLDIGPGYQVKRLYIAPGQAISLQYHEHRSETWTVVAGQPLITLGHLHEVYLPPCIYLVLPRVRHRIENSTSSPVVVIEVQMGELIDEGDIVRLEDQYGRVVGGTQNTQ